MSSGSLDLSFDGRQLIASFFRGTNRIRPGGDFSLNRLSAYLFEQAVIEEPLRISILGLGMIEELE